MNKTEACMVMFLMFLTLFACPLIMMIFTLAKHWMDTH